VIALQRFLLAIVVAALLPLAHGALAAQSPATGDSAISQLAARLADPLQKAHATKIIFANLEGPNGEVHPVGRWLADQLAAACSKDFPSLEIIVRPAAEAENTPEFQKDPPKSVEDWARRVGANVVVKGTYARYPDGLGISLTALTAAEPSDHLGEATGLIPITAEMTALSAEPIPTQAGPAPHAGVGGVGIPECVYCPAPGYTDKGRKDGVQGNVVLQVTVTAEGRATDISVKTSLSPDMDAQAIKVVGTWEFKPARGPGGRPMAVTCPIEITFRLYNHP